jgi:RecB family endonuclease NucS
MDERSVSVGRLRRVPLREVWPHEALDFTVWLQDNLEVLNEHLDTPLANAEREQAAGAFSVDLVAEDDDGRAVVIENQLERSNHDHLGKLLTYLAAYEASTAIWIVAEPRAEHVKAVAWLNDSSQANVYRVCPGFR